MSKGEVIQPELSRYEDEYALLCVWCCQKQENSKPNKRKYDVMIVHSICQINKKTKPNNFTYMQNMRKCYIL